MGNNKYRLYVDETGNSNYPRSKTNAVGQRFLGLAGIAITENEILNTVKPQIQDLKYFLTGDYDEKISLHRDEIKERKGFYAKLSIPENETIWNEKIKKLITETEYILFGVVIDKVGHREKYHTPNHPYYYCLDIILERYVRCLELLDAKGDVMFESRGKKEDDELRLQYSRIYNYGTSYLNKEIIQKRLTSKDIKLKTKKSFIEGLELADLLALSTKLDVLKSYGLIDNISSKFVCQIIDWTANKYYFNGRKGYGKKMLQ